MTAPRAFRRHKDMDPPLLPASLLGHYAYCPRAAWYRMHGTPASQAALERMECGKTAHRQFSRDVRNSLLLSAFRRLLLALFVLGGILWLLRR